MRRKFTHRLVIDDSQTSKLKRNKLNPSDYRAISLLSLPGKISNHVLLQRIEIHSERFTCDNQFGFRQKRETIYAILIV